MSILQSQARQSAINGATTGREKLEERYAHLLEERFALRQHVTYVPNKSIPIQRWFRYKEAFSSDLVRLLLEEFGADPHTHRVFDPFAGCGSTILAAKQLGFGAWGTGREQPPLSFMATILVDRVAREAQEWLDQGKLTSVYNLTQIAEDETTERQFLSDLTSFLGYEAV